MPREPGKACPSDVDFTSACRVQHSGSPEAHHWTFASGSFTFSKARHRSLIPWQHEWLTLLTLDKGLLTCESPSHECQSSGPMRLESHNLSSQKGFYTLHQWNGLRHWRNTRENSHNYFFLNISEVSACHRPLSPIFGRLFVYLSYLLNLQTHQDFIWQYTQHVLFIFGVFRTKAFTFSSLLGTGVLVRDWFI